MARPSLITRARWRPPCSTVMSATGSRFSTITSASLPGLQLADLALEAHREGVALGRGRDRLQRREAAIAHQDLRLLGVQLAERHEGVVAAVGAAQQPDAELARALHQRHDIVEVPLHAVEVELHLLGADALALLDDAPRGRSRSAGSGCRPSPPPRDRPRWRDRHGRSNRPRPRPRRGSSRRRANGWRRGDCGDAPRRPRRRSPPCASICVVPERLSAILMKLTPCLSWRRTSVTISAALLQSTPIEWSGVPTQAGSSSSMQP